MIYVLSINLKNSKYLHVELSKLYGVGKYQVIKVCNKLNIGFGCCVGDLNQSHLYMLLKQMNVQNLILDAELKKQKSKIILFFMNMKSYKGIRHIFNLPVRGQRTRTNSSSRKNTIC
jgi:small subunit ribosomal protein S13